MSMTAARVHQCFFGFLGFLFLFFFTIYLLSLIDLKGSLSSKINIIAPQSAMQDKTDYKAVAYFVNWCVGTVFYVVLTFLTRAFQGYLWKESSTTGLTRAPAHAHTLCLCKCQTRKWRGVGSLLGEWHRNRLGDANMWQLPHGYME